MFRSLRHLWLLLSIVVLTAMLPGTPGPAYAGGGNSTPCFDIRVDFLGRLPVQNIGGVQYYRWTYRVYGRTCINRGLSHWVLNLCSGTQHKLWGVSSQSNDITDPLGGTVSNYSYSMGPDPTTSVNGLKWDFVGGNAIDKANECDEFSFIASGQPTPTIWAAKGSTIVVSGTVIGPGCSPVPVELTSWGTVKTLFR